MKSKTKTRGWRVRRQKWYLHRFLGGWDNIFLSAFLSRGPWLPQLFRKTQMHRLQRSSKPWRGFWKRTFHQRGGKLNSWPQIQPLIEMFYSFFVLFIYLPGLFYSLWVLYLFPFFNSFLLRQRLHFNVEFQLLPETSVFHLLLQHVMTMNFFH